MRATMGWIGLVLVAGAGAGWSRDLPAHSVRFDPAAAVCRVVLEPAGTTGEEPPRFVLTSGLLAPEFGFVVEGSDVAEAVLVHRGARVPFLPRRGLSAAAFLDDPLWSQFGAPAAGAGDGSASDAASGGADAAAEGAAQDSLYLTVRNAEGRYSSSRYDGLSRDDVLRLLLLACDAPDIAAPALTEVEHRAAERRLDLPAADALLLRRFLAARYGEAGMDVGSDARFTVTDRRHIRSYNDENGHPSGDYLWPEAVPALLEEARKAVPPEPVATAGDTAGTPVARHGDWAVTVEGALCRSGTVAVGAEGLDEGLRMEFAVNRSGRGGMMAIDLVKPNPFRADMPLAASVDGEGYALAVEPSTGAVIPRPQPDGSMTRDLTLALRRGKSVVIEGVSAVTGAPARVAFSAKGFSAAFAEMATACDRPAVKGWIE